MDEAGGTKKRALVVVEKEDLGKVAVVLVLLVKVERKALDNLLLLVVSALVEVRWWWVMSARAHPDMVDITVRHKRRAEADNLRLVVGRLCLLLRLLCSIAVVNGMGSAATERSMLVFSIGLVNKINVLRGINDQSSWSSKTKEYLYRKMNSF